MLQANPILDVPANFPNFSSARYKRKTVSCLTTAVGLKTSFSSHFTLSFRTGQKNSAVESGINIGFTSSAFMKGNRAQLSSRWLSASGLFSDLFAFDEFLQKKFIAIIRIISVNRINN